MITPQAFSAAPHPEGGVVVCGKRFASDPDARAWLAAAIERRGQLRGAPIETLREFFGDDRKRTPLTREEDQARQNWSIPMPAPPERDPFGDMRAGDGTPAKPGSKARLKAAQDAARKQYEERLEREAPPSDEVLRYRQWAYDVWEALLMSDATEAELTRAEQLKQWAHTDGADMSAFQDAAREFTEEQKSRRDGKAAEIEARRAALEKELATLPPAPVAPGDTPGIPHGYKAVKNIGAANGEVSYSVVAVEPEAHGGYRVHASYSEDNVPTEIKEAAQ